MEDKKIRGNTIESPRNPKVDAFIAGEKKWKPEFAKLREIVLECPVEEDFKWRVPCYMVNGGNVVMIHGFKEYCAILFVKGALLKDPAGILIQQTANVQAARQIRFTSLQQIMYVRSCSHKTHGLFQAQPGNLFFNFR